MHIHKPRNENVWRGHWIVSLGNGLAAGCNNNMETTPGYAGTYSRHLTVRGQVLGHRNARLYDGGPLRVVVIDPLQIPYNGP